MRMETSYRALSLVGPFGFYTRPTRVALTETSTDFTPGKSCTESSTGQTVGTEAFPAGTLSAYVRQH